MKTASIRDLHIRTSELVDEAASGTVILIERHGEGIAELRPLSKRPNKSLLPELRDLWRRFPLVDWTVDVF